MDYQHIISTLGEEIQQLPSKGETAQYIPELSKVDPNKFGIHLTTTTGTEASFGDSDELFSIQSIAKVLALTLALNKLGGKLWTRVGVEPSGTAFNSLIQLELERGIPRNPMINAGAIVICDVLMDNFENPKQELLHFIRKVSGIATLEYNTTIATSEKSVGYRNMALINLMKSLGNIRNEVDAVLDFYYHLCSIEMTCKQVSRTFLFLANSGIEPYSQERIVTESKAKRINAIMQLCGFYDEAGEFSFKVGLPGKSGVGGGIIAIHPKKYTIVVWSPRLNKKGNSFKGMRFLEAFTSKTESSIF